MRKRRIAVLSLSGIALLGAVCFWFWQGPASRQRRPSGKTVVQVRVIKPKLGGMERTTTQPGTLHAYEYEDVFAKVSGFLVRQRVDIGAEVKEGDLLSEIYAPELDKEEQLAAANVEQAKAQVEQMEAHKKAAEADVQAAEFLVLQRQAEKKRALANLKFREGRHRRYVNLNKQESVVEQDFVDEQFEQLEAAKSWKDAAEAAISTAIADGAAKTAKVTRAEADIAAAKANLKVTEASLGKAREFVGFTRILSHYNGKVTHRYFHKGAYIRAADKGGSTPLYTVKRTDKMRMIVKVPDIDAPDADPNDPVDLVISTLPYVKFPQLKIARIAYSQDERSRTMRVEVDVPNKDGLLRDGMYGEVTIHLQKAAQSAFTVPRGCLHRRNDQWALYLVREGLTCIAPVRIGNDDGHHAEILSGLRATDLVVMDHVGRLHERVAVETLLVEETAGGQ